MPKFDGFIPAFLAAGLPAAFLVSDAVLKKLLFKQADFYFFGADMAFCGSVLFVSTFLRELSLNHITDGTRAAVYVIVGLAFFLLWLLVARLGNLRIRWVSILAALFGLVIFSCCSVVTWGIITPLKEHHDSGTNTRIDH